MLGGLCLTSSGDNGCPSSHVFSSLQSVCPPPKGDALHEEQAGALLNVQTLLGVHDLLLVAFASATNSPARICEWT